MHKELQDHASKLEVTVGAHGIFNSGKYTALVEGKNCGAVHEKLRLQFESQYTVEQAEKLRQKRSGGSVMSGMPPDEMIGIERRPSSSRPGGVAVVRVHPLILVSLLDQEQCAKIILPHCRSTCANL